MRQNWMAALVVSSSLVGSAALADWESPVAFNAEDDWEAPRAATADDDWEAPRVLTPEDGGVYSWESPRAFAGGDFETSSCLQAVVVKWQSPRSPDDVYIQGFWDACGQDGATGWQSYELVDVAWWDSYVSVNADRPTYRTRVVQDAAGWHGQLYNVRLGSWETKAFTKR